jgi:nicotinamide mononucleotide transporter
MTWPEIIGVIFGVLCVLLTIRQSIWCWPTGLIQVLVFIWVFYDAKLYSDFILHIIYSVLQIYGWWYWLHPSSTPNPTDLKVTSLPAIHIAAWIVVTVIGTALWGAAMATLTDAAAPFPDAFLAVSSLIAQWLLTRKNLESWYFWIIVDITAIPLFISRDLHLTAALYAVFLILAITGLFAWRKSMHAAPPQAANP